MIGRVTRLIILVCLTALIGWTSVAAAIGGPLDTVSAHVRDYMAQYPVLVFIIGALFGHWGFSMTPAVKRDGLK